MSKFILILKDLSIMTGSFILVCKAIDEVRKLKLDYDVYKNETECKMRERKKKCDEFCKGK